MADLEVNNYTLSLRLDSTDRNSNERVLFKSIFISNRSSEIPLFKLDDNFIPSHAR